MNAENDIDIIQKYCAKEKQLNSIFYSYFKDGFFLGLDHEFGNFFAYTAFIRKNPEMTLVDRLKICGKDHGVDRHIHCREHKECERQRK